jgi:hypothetical protein
VKGYGACLRTNSAGRRAGCQNAEMTTSCLSV